MQKTQIEKQDIKSMNLAEIREVMVSMGQPSFRAAQVYRWLHRGVISFEQMSDLSGKISEASWQRGFIFPMLKFSVSRFPLWMGR